MDAIAKALVSVEPFPAPEKCNLVFLVFSVTVPFSPSFSYHLAKLASTLTLARRFSIVATRIRDLRVRTRRNFTTTALRSTSWTLTLKALQKLSVEYSKPTKTLAESLQAHRQSYHLTSLTKPESPIKGTRPVLSTLKQKYFRCQKTRRNVLLEPLQTGSGISKKTFAIGEEPGLKSLQMDTQIQIISTPTADTPGTTLLLQTNKQNYIFGNIAEGTQRSLTQTGGRLTKVRDFFITGKTEWSNVGGLIGMALTMADSASSAYEMAMDTWQQKKKGPKPTRPNLNLYGPPNLKHLLGTCRRFIFRKGLPMNAIEYTDSATRKTDEGFILPSWQDSNILVWALAIAPAHNPSDANAEAVLASKREAYDAKLNNFEEHKALESESPDDRELRYDRIRTAVVNQMFDSNWSFDTLVERHISEVEMPTAMFVRNQNTNQLESYRGPLPGGKEPVPDIKVLTRTPWPGALVTALPPTTPAPEAVSYIVRTHPARGKFDVKRAKELGVKPGPDFSRLTSGESVHNAQGETITPDMVMGPDRPGQGVAILDVPSLEHLESLVHREELQSDRVMEGIQACIWLLGPGLSGHPTFQQFTQTLSRIQHVISSVDDCPNRLAMDSVAAQTIRLGQIDADRYRVPFHDNTTLPQKGLYNRHSREGGPLQNAIVADRGMKFRLMPKWSLQQDAITPLLDITDIAQSTSSDVIELAKAAQKSIESDKESLQAWRQLITHPDTEVITLGTGSALPSKYRNVSATLVKVPGIGNYLLDCGENTLGQLRRVFNPDELVDVLRNLRMIWISHLHADHHLGTASVIKAWYSLVHNSVPASTPPSIQSMSTCAPMYGLSVISHEGMLKWLWEYSSIEDFGYSRIVPLSITPVTPGSDSGSTLTLTPPPSSPAYKNEYTLRRKDYQTVLGLSDIQACKVAHCHGSMAVSLTFPESSPELSFKTKTTPLKVSYSGDCRPSHNFTHIGRDSTVLIHEATFDDELQGDAKAKKHSTTSEALGIGTRMNAKAVVLTHFSQRYQKIPVLETTENGEEEDDLLEPNAMEDVVQEEQGEADEPDPTADNPDITTARAGAALPSDKAPKHHQADEHARIIKVRSKDMKVAVAFDYMRVKIGDIAQLEKFNPALNKLLVAEEAEGEGAKEELNSNGKKMSGDDGEGSKKRKKVRNN